MDFVNWIDISDEIKKNNDFVKSEELNFIDVFAGAGGMSLGLTMAGFTPVGSVEILEPAVATYKRYFSEFTNEIIYPKDIRLPETKTKLINSVKDKHIHLICGGFPCQGFSISGKRVVTDERNSLYLDMLEIVEKIQPDFIFMENVEGLRSMLGGEVEKKILSDYAKIGYNINVTVLNSADYCVPQIRKRVIFIGNRIGKINYHPKPVLKPNEYKTVKDAIERFLYIPENKDINHIFSKHTKEMQERLSAVEEGNSLYGNYSDAWRKVFWDKPSITVKENHGGVNIHPKLPRVMTPRELASLQSFPDDFIFEGSKKWQLVQIGNAVPPLMAKAVGLAIKKSINSEFCNTNTEFVAIIPEQLTFC